MSTISGCWRDGRVPGGVGVLATSNGVFFVVHEPTPLCDTCEPHHADECGNFKPPRRRIRRDVDGPPKPIYWMQDWPAIFAQLDAGVSVFEILDQQIARGPVAP
jgi:hypothetical protein